MIPARGGSKGVPRKNLRVVGGRSLLVRAVDAASSSGLARTVVSTDDDEIAAAARHAGADVPFLRPATLATDGAGAIETIQHAAATVDPEGRYDAVMMLQPTTPFRTADDIDRALSMLASDDAADSVISVVDVGGHHPARMKYLVDGVLVDPTFAEQRENQPRQELPPMYIRNGAVYLTRRAVLDGGSFKGSRSLALEMPPERSVNIDTELDLRYAELLALEGGVGPTA